MDPRFIQYELRYSPILNFGQLYKDIVSKYLAFDDVKPSFSNYGMFDEHVILDFSSNNYQIDFRLDRLIFRYEGDYKLIYNSSGPCKFFFDVLEEVKKLKSFGKVKQAIIQIKSVELLELTNEAIVEAFRAKFLQQSADQLLPNFSDMALTLEKEDGIRFHNLVFGPFETKDIVKQGISPLKSSFNKDLEGNGLMASYLYTEITDKSSFSFFKDTLVEMVSKTQNIKIQ